MSYSISLAIKGNKESISNLIELFDRAINDEENNDIIVEFFAQCKINENPLSENNLEFHIIEGSPNSVLYSGKTYSVSEYVIDDPFPFFEEIKKTLKVYQSFV